MTRAVLLLVLACGCDRLLGLTSVAPVPDAPMSDAAITGEWTQVTGGKYHTCAIDSANRLYCWGSNARAQLGLAASSAYELSPVRVSGSWSAVASQDVYSCAIAADGSLSCWGHEDTGEIGNGVASGDFFSPVPVLAPTGTQWLAVATATSHTCAIQSDHSLWCWGSNVAGESDPTAPSPVAMPTKLVDPGVAWTAVAVGDHHTCAIDSDGQLWCWGLNDRGQTGNGTTGGTTTPVALSGATGSTTAWTAVSAAGSHVCAVQAGELACWGGNAFGQLGDGTTANRDSPTLVAANGTWQTVAAADMHTCALQADQTWWCWGRGDSGELAMPDASAQPRAIPGSWLAIGVGSSHSCAIDAGHALYCVGLDADGQLGDGRGGPVTSPAAIGGAVWSSVIAGFDTSCAIQNGELECWGDNAAGQVADHTRSPRQEPYLVDTAQLGAAATRQTHTCEIATNGAMRCAGDNTHGNFGIAPGTLPGSTSMVAVATGLTWKRLAVGRSLTCAISTEATPKLYCSGLNDKGQAAVSGGADVTSPTAVTATGTPTAVGAGDSFACGLFSSNAYCWGYSTSGETGRAANTSSAAPNKLTGTFSQLAVGGIHVCALDQNGAMYCWGDNGFGQLGDSTQTDTTTPVPVAAGKLWTRIAAGSLHTCAIDDQQAMYCWGRNTSGQLGDGTRVEHDAPMLVSGTERWLDVAAGDAHTCGLTSAGLLRCWGSRSSGQVGDGMAWRPTLALVPNP